MPILVIGSLFHEHKNSMLNRHLALACALLCLPLVFGMGCLRPRPRIVQNQAPSPSQDTMQSAAVLAYARLNGGSADLMRDASTASLQDGQALAEGDEIKVKSGMIELVYPDAGISQLEPGADIVLLAQTDQVREGEVAADIQLVAGSIWTRFERLLGNTERFSVTSNGIVATVRGTAFGVAAEMDGSVDIQVADHQVEVGSQQEEEVNARVKNSVILQTGQGIKLKAVDFRSAPAVVRGLVRKLGPNEKGKAGFVFGSRSLKREELQKPTNAIPLLKLPALPEAYRLRIQFLHQREALRREALRFGSPTTTPDLNPNTEPGTSGPNSLQVDTKATILINGKPL